MKIAVPTAQDRIDQHFCHCEACKMSKIHNNAIVAMGDGADHACNHRIPLPASAAKPSPIKGQIN